MTTSEEPAAGAHDDRPRPRDELPRHPLRGPLLFGVIAATLELGALLWIVSC